jgi:hypothetical protein
MEISTFAQGKKETAKINKILFDTMQGKNISFKVLDYSDEYFSKIYIDVYNYLKFYGSKYDGMQIIYEAGIYEVSEFQAGKNQNELHIYKETKSFKIALKSLLIGNKQKPIKIWN